MENNVVDISSTKHYNLENIDFSKSSIGFLHPITKLTQKLRIILLKYGFREINSEILTSNFWNTEVLLVSQGRIISDASHTINIDTHSREFIPQTLLDSVSSKHLTLFNYHLDKDKSSKYVLKSHTTQDCVKELFKKGKGRYFSIDYVFRNTNTRSENIQCDILINDSHVSLINIQSFIRDILHSLFPQISDIKFKPNFFEFANPSFGIVGNYEFKKVSFGAYGFLRDEISSILHTDNNTAIIGFSIPWLASLLTGDGYKNKKNHYTNTLPKRYQVKL